MPSSTSPSEPRPSTSFAALDPRVQRWVWEQGWTELRDAQERAIPVILARERDVLIVAATAWGKTEAAFLPICSHLLTTPDAGTGVRVLYVSPLKALINDQYRRLDDLCEHLDLRVGRWHGDVSSSVKTRLRRDGTDVLLITPESLEALLIRQPQSLAGLFGSLRYVVIDELHVFLGTERGAHLQSLLHRVDLLAGTRAPRIGLSATVGDTETAAAFLAPDHPEQVRIITSSASGAGLRLQVRGYETGHDDDGGMDALVGDLLGVTRDGQHLVFANSRHRVERYADGLARAARHGGHADLVLAHHGNLDQGLRAHVEARLGDPSRPVTVVCTSTLELGIDIGTMTAIAQLGAPPSVAALRQRLGRSGRRHDPAVLRVYVTEAALDATSPPVDALRVELVQTIAMIDLMLQRWCEPVLTGDLHLSTLVHQTLSLITQHGGVSPTGAYRALCGPGPFATVDERQYGQLLRDLGAAGLIEQARDGTLLLGAAGERLVEHHHFYAAFATPDEYRLLSGGRQLGTLPITTPVRDGALLIFAGQRWTITRTDLEARTLELVPASGGIPPRFAGTGIPVHDRVRREMHHVYRDTTVAPFLDRPARDLLAEARAMYRHLRLDQSPLLAWGEDTMIFPWVGDRIVTTIALALQARDLQVDTDGLTITVRDFGPDETRAELHHLHTGPPPVPEDLAALVTDRRSDKYDWALGDTLLNGAYAGRHLDVSGAWHTIGRLLDAAPVPLERPRNTGRDHVKVRVSPSKE